jgi:outer membrane protein insertion porin family
MLLAVLVPAVADGQMEGTGVAAGEEVVREVEIRSAAAVRDLDRVLDLVDLVPGEAMTSARVRETIRDLHSAGIATEIEVWSRPHPEGGVIAMVVLHPRVRIGEVVLEGELGLRREVVRELLEPKRGQPLLESQVLRSVYRLQDRYREEGYFEARVRPAIEVDPATRLATVAFEIESGPRAVVGSVSFTGELAPFGPKELEARLPSPPGERYRRDAGEHNAEALARWLREQGHRLAEVDLVEARYDVASTSVNLEYEAVVGPRVELQVLGADLERLRKRGLLPFLGEEGYDEILVLQAIERIERYYQERGHYRVRVTRREERTDGDLVLTLTVDPGPEYVLREIDFMDNVEVSDGRLQELVSTTPRQLLVPGSGRLVEQVLEEDLENVRSYYALHGWSRARVGPYRVEEVADGELRLVVPVQEGPRSRVVTLDVAGNHAMARDELLADLPLVEGGPFHPILLEEVLDRVRFRYERRGYAEARVSATTDWNESRTLVDVGLSVLEGPRRTAGHLILRGNVETRDEVIRRVASLEPGEPLSRERLLEIQRSLYQLGVFFRVEVELAPLGDDPTIRDVLVRVVEGRTQRLSYGLGWDSEEGLGGLFGYSHANVGGRAIRFQIDLRQSEKTERYRLLTSRPYAHGFSLTGLVFQEADERPSFAVEQQGTQLEVARTRDRDRLSLFLDYRQSDLTLAPNVVLADADLPAGQEGRRLMDIQITSLTPRIVVDRRDDPLNPTRGNQLTLQVQYAVPVEEVSTENFLKGFGQYVQYQPLGGDQVLAASLRIGAIERLGEQPVSLAERFFAGGRTSHRAYDRDVLGIPGETLDGNGQPVGGGGLLLLNLDYRFPIAGAFGGAIFADGGNVWRDYVDIDPAGFKWGVGLGLRYLSPVGPLRLEWGFKLDREPGESPSEVFISFGNAF